MPFCRAVLVTIWQLPAIDRHPDLDVVALHEQIARQFDAIQPFCRSRASRPAASSSMSRVSCSGVGRPRIQ